MNRSANLDLSALTFDEFIRFFFQRPEDQEYWYLDAAYQYGNVTISRPTNLLIHATRLFSDFGAIARNYTLAQVDHGIWALLGSNDVSITTFLFDDSIPVEQRVQCIRSMAHVYSDFVVGYEEDERESCFNMWWDLLGDEFWSIAELTQHKEPSLLNEDRRAILDAMFETLRLILELPDPRVQGYALHGLGHMHHPSVPALVQKFINDHLSELTPDRLRWVEQCRDGTVM